MTKFSLQAVLSALSGLGIGVTKGVDAVRNFVARHLSGWRVPKYVWNVLGFAFGIGTAVQTNINLLVGSPIADHASLLTQQILTGLMIGGAAAVGHEGLDWLSGAAKARHVTVTVEESKQRIADDPHGGESMPDDIKPDEPVA